MPPGATVARRLPTDPNLKTKILHKSNYPIWKIHVHIEITKAKRRVGLYAVTVSMARQYLTSMYVEYLYTRLYSIVDCDGDNDDDIL